MATALCALIGAALLVGCAPQTSSTPTPTPHFTSEQQAYAAAEQTYRNYIDALNKVDLSDPATFEDVYKWGTGKALSGDKKNLTGLHSEGAVLSGESIVQLAAPATIDAATHDVDIFVCLNVSAIDVRNAEGKSLVDKDRPDVQTTTVTLSQSAASPTGLLVAEIDGRSDGPRC